MTTTAADAMWVLGGAQIFTAYADMVPGASGTVEMPIAMFLVQHGDDLLLIDTGLAPEAAENEDAIYGSMRPILITKMRREQVVDAQLASIGKTTADVTHVALSHGHFDHSGGLKLFPDATLIMHAREWEHVKGAPKGRAAPVRDVDFAHVTEDKLDLFEGDYDVFGDGSVILLEMPGHTPGNLSVLISLPSQSLLLSLDIVHVREAFEQEAVSHIDTSGSDALASIKRMKELEVSTGAELWVTHDLGDWIAFGAPGRQFV